MSNARVNKRCNVFYNASITKEITYWAMFAVRGNA
jgi:hypothetical protein